MEAAGCAVELTAKKATPLEAQLRSCNAQMRASLSRQSRKHSVASPAQ